MSLTIVRMNTASSQTSTVLLTLPPLSDYLLNHCLDIEHEHRAPIDLDDARHCTSHRNICLSCGSELIDRYVLNVANVVDSNANPSLHKVYEQNQPFAPLERSLAQRSSAVDHSHDRSAKIDEPADRVRCAGQPRHLLGRHDLAECNHVAGETLSSQIEYEQAP